MSVIYDDRVLKIELDLSKARDNEDILEPYGIEAHQLIVQEATGTFEVRINDISATPITLETGDHLTMMKITKLYVTNSAQPGAKAILLLTYSTQREVERKGILKVG